jgi:hypothetical protein
MQNLPQELSEDALHEYLARMGLTDGRVKQQPLRQALRSILELCDEDRERLLDDPLLQSIRAIAERALEGDTEPEES